MRLLNCKNKAIQEPRPPGADELSRANPLSFELPGGCFNPKRSRAQRQVMPAISMILCLRAGHLEAATKSARSGMRPTRYYAVFARDPEIFILFAHGVRKRLRFSRGRRSGFALTEVFCVSGLWMLRLPPAAPDGANYHR